MNAGTIAEHQPKIPDLAITSAAASNALTFPLNSQIATRQHFRTIAGRLEDAVLLLLVVYLLPMVILLVGAPIALCVRAIIAIVRLVF